MSDLTIPTDEFWRVLLDHGAVDEVLAEEFRKELTDSTWKPLGRILIDEGHLTVKQVAGLISMQADEPHMRIGDLAIREEHCTLEDIHTALEIQAEGAPRPAELVLRDCRVAEDKLMNALASYIRHLEGRVHVLRETVAGRTVTAD